MDIDKSIQRKKDMKKEITNEVEVREGKENGFRCVELNVFEISDASASDWASLVLAISESKKSQSACSFSILNRK